MPRATGDHDPGAAYRGDNNRQKATRREDDDAEEDDRGTGRVIGRGEVRRRPFHEQKIGIGPQGADVVFAPLDQEHVSGLEGDSGHLGAKHPRLPPNAENGAAERRVEACLPKGLADQSRGGGHHCLGDLPFRPVRIVLVLAVALSVAGIGS